MAKAKLHVSRLAARTRKVSGPKMSRNPMRIRPTFQWLFQNDVCKFESYMPCRAAESGKVLSAIIFDIDHFKDVNDTHGHEVGDAVLAAISKPSKSAATIVGRIGGEEFCLVEHCELADATDIADRLRCSIASLRFGEESGFGIT